MIEGHNRWSEMLGKGEVDGSRTVECLRGRLLAERLASRAAREEAELMSKRLTELERLLAEEIKARNKAERRLKRMLKKLESLKIFDVSCQSNVSEGSGCSSSACFCGIPMLGGGGEEEEEKTSSQKEESAQCYADGEAKQVQLNFSSSEDRADEASGTASPCSVNQSVSQEESWASVKTAHSHGNSPKSLCTDEFNSESTRERAIDEKDPHIAQHQIEDVDDRLAIVPARIWSDTEVVSEPQRSSNVEGVLIALKQVKMQLQNSLGRRMALSPKELCGL